MVKVNCGIALAVLILFVMVYSLLSSKCDEWDRGNFPPFVQRLSKNGTEDYCSLYERKMNLSKYDFYYSLLEWAEKYQVLGEMERFINQEMKYERKLNKLLVKKLRNINGTSEAKNVLFKILKLQRNVFRPLIEIDQTINRLMGALPERIRHEATVLWNMLSPHDICA
ncbi:unnamed protein product [Litomosoides sigmodontis]|uniref:SXP/RAL-2 family protein Ani s 5-like cation-binding domain-containing protein n=1 Tax=Litomosoides sigmodontis TaxID=42156 RepID=A0A3P6TNC9_LITSI|nr:unnamed protein product [Litomosoides sigmodontis]